jgi:hypothetical protein
MPFQKSLGSPLSMFGAKRGKPERHRQTRIFPAPTPPRGQIQAIPSQHRVDVQQDLDAPFHLGHAKDVIGPHVADKWRRLIDLLGLDLQDLGNGIHNETCLGGPTMPLEFHHNDARTPGIFRLRHIFIKLELDI